MKQRDLTEVGGMKRIRWQSAIASGDPSNVGRGEKEKEKGKNSAI